MTPEQVARFWAKVDKSGGPDACWEWQGPRNSGGYGIFYWNGHTRPTNRIAEELARGPMPAKLQSCHKCDNPPCCNPAHLFRGTAAENAADKFAKRRDRVSTVSPADVPHIRAEYAAGASKKELAAKYGLGPFGIHAIVNRITWPNI